VLERPSGCEAPRLLVIALDIHVAAAATRCCLDRRAPSLLHAGCLRRHSERISIALIGRCVTAKDARRLQPLPRQGTDPRGDFVEIFTGQSKR